MRLANVVNRFPVGTTVNAYLQSAFPLGWRSSDGLPSGAVSQANAVVQTDGSLTFTGLTEDTAYRAYASVASTPTFLGFTVDEAADSEAGPATITVASVDAFGNWTAWTENGIDYEATYDGAGNLVTQGEA